MRSAILPLIILLVLVIPISTSPASACSCIPPAPAIESLERAAAVFSGKVIQTEETHPPDATVLPVVEVTFQVSQVWKGSSDETLMITTLLAGATCGLGGFFQAGEEYVVYASGLDDRLTASLCSRTTHLSNAREDVAELNKLADRPPDLAQFDSPRPDPMPDPSPVPDERVPEPLEVIDDNDLGLGRFLGVGIAIIAIGGSLAIMIRRRLR